MVKALGCGPRYLSSILSVHTMPVCANWHSGLPQNQVFQSSSLWAGTKVMALQLSRQSRGLKILVSVVRFHPKPPYAGVAEQVDAMDLKSIIQRWVCGFKSRGRYHLHSWRNWQPQQSQKLSSKGMQVRVLPDAPYSGIAQMARATDSYPVGRRFKSYFRYHFVY